VFDRRSLKWMLNNVGRRLFGIPWLANRALLRHGMSIASHVKPSRNHKLKTIGWIPDFQHLHLPHFFSATEVRNRTAEFLDLLARSNLVVVSSEAARRDLEEFAPAFSAKARVLHFSALPPAPQASSANIRAAYGLQNVPYFYIPNQAWAHKNHLTAIRALAELHLEFPSSMVVCSGALTDYRNPNHLSTLRAEIEQLGLTKRFVLLGVVPYEHIAPLMLSAVATINPSLFEGWSTTVEEGKALGVPMILSDIDVHREQCSLDEADFFEPLDPLALAERMRARLGATAAPARPPACELLERHRLRSLDFAREYCRVVEELHDAP
jgi:glycosyltransferase involved in cell wall biosynthesis